MTKKYKTPASNYSAEIYAKTKKYQKIYVFGLKDCKYDSASSFGNV